ncbi:AraC-like DNA-binding protein [Nitrobacteraceae bacterium AZCC 1564]
MTHVYDRIFENYRVLDAQDQPVEDTYSKLAFWLEPPGCVVQRSDFSLPVDVHSDGIVKPGLFLSIVLEGSGRGGTSDGVDRHSYSDNQMLAMAVREPTLCNGDAPGGSHMRAVGVAFPLPSIQRLGLESEFTELFRTTERPVLSMTLPATPRVQALAAEMLSPTIEGQAGQLLIKAQATELLARSLFALRHRADIDPPSGNKRARLQSVKELMDADPSYPWSIAELARRAGSSRRTFNIQFRAVYGVSANDYLRNKRLGLAREALVHQNLSVTEAAYVAGYSNPANFATAFRKYFGAAPSAFRAQR